MLLLESGEDMSEKNVGIAEQALYGAEKRGDIPSIAMWEQAREQANEQRKRGMSLRHTFEQQIKEYSYAMEYLEGIDEQSANPLVQELRDISKEYLELFEEDDQKLFGKFDFATVENVGEYVPAMVIEEGQNPDVFLSRLFDGAKVIPIDNAVVDKVRSKYEEEKEANKANA